MNLIPNRDEWIKKEIKKLNDEIKWLGFQRGMVHKERINKKLHKILKTAWENGAKELVERVHER